MWNMLHFEICLNDSTCLAQAVSKSSLKRTDMSFLFFSKAEHKIWFGVIVLFFALWIQAGSARHSGGRCWAKGCQVARLKCSTSLASRQWFPSIPALPGITPLQWRGSIALGRNLVAIMDLNHRSALGSWADLWDMAEARMATLDLFVFSIRDIIQVVKTSPLMSRRWKKSRRAELAAPTWMLCA